MKTHKHGYLRAHKILKIPPKTTEDVDGMLKRAINGTTEGHQLGQVRVRGFITSGFRDQNIVENDEVNEVSENKRRSFKF